MKILLGTEAHGGRARVLHRVVYRTQEVTPGVYEVRGSTPGIERIVVAKLVRKMLQAGVKSITIMEGETP